LSQIDSFFRGTQPVTYLVGLPVQVKENQPLDLDKAYPCPSCRQGSLIPITLTEAWGCDRCKQIFEKTAADTVGKLVTPYHRQRTWRWNGQHWIDNSQRVQTDSLKSWATITFLGGLLWVGLSRIAVPGFWIIGIFALILLLVVMFWVLRQR
jgi:ribosomal protein L37AE/L43A